jgi:hypothetical protein
MVRLSLIIAEALLVRLSVCLEAVVNEYVNVSWFFHAIISYFPPKKESLSLYKETPLKEKYLGPWQTPETLRLLRGIKAAVNSAKL